MIKGDSAASSHYIRTSDQKCLSNIIPYTGTSFMLPDADSIPTSHQCNLNLHDSLSLAASMGTILPNLKSSSLLSLGKICDDDCEVLLQKKNYMF